MGLNSALQIDKQCVKTVCSASPRLNVSEQLEGTVQMLNPMLRFDLS